MLSIRRESLLMSDSGVREPLDPSGEVVKACRKNDPIACVPDGARKLREYTVAGRIGDPPTMLRDETVGHLPM